MLVTDTRVPESPFEFAAPKKRVSLSTYFPAGTHYFYAYPAGEASGFLNKVPPKVEELVAARTLSCAGPDVSVIKFTATHHSVVGADIIEALGMPQLPEEQITLLPSEIDSSLKGEARNTAIKNALEKNIEPGTLIMAQPYTDTHLAHLYQIPTQLTTWVNDKNNMEQYILPKYLPKRYGVYLNGFQFNEHHKDITLPCVVKVSSSSSGDGVYICRSEEDMRDAMEELLPIVGTIFVEQFIETKKNFGIHFGIPYDKSQPIDLIGVNEQLTTADGEFIGGIIESSRLPQELLPLERYLLDDVLPKIRDMGWYGIGCFDVLCDADDQLFLIDSNFRITGMSAYHLLISRGTIQTPMMSFNGEFEGTRKQFEDHLYHYASKDSPKQIIQMIALTHYGNNWSFNAAISFDNRPQLKDRVHTLLHLGVKSAALSELANNSL